MPLRTVCIIHHINIHYVKIHEADLKMNNVLVSLICDEKDEKNANIAKVTNLPAHIRQIHIKYLY